jgi:hypothetical protein
MLGTPTSGTWSALLGVAMAPFGRASLQLLPDSAFLRDLDQGALPEGVEVVSVAGERDHLAPSGSTHLAGVRHISVSANHAGLLGDAKVARLVGEILSSPSPTNSSINNPAAH